MPITVGESTERSKRLGRELINAIPEICAERALLVTESYQETEGELIIIRRAKALRKTLREMTLVIEDEQLIVGLQGSGLGKLPVFPEFSSEWIIDELDYFETRHPKILIAEESKATLRRVLPYWKGNTIEDYIEARAPEYVMTACAAAAITRYGVLGGVGCFAPDYATVINQGLDSIVAQAESRARAVKEGTSPERDLELQFLEAAIISCRAVIEFAGRYAALARERASSARNPQRRQELLRIAEICGRVPAAPARNFYEAVQSVFFIFLAIQIESNGRSIALGRFDQYMYPFYQRDLVEGRLTRAGAQELLECLFVKIASVNKLREASAAAMRPTMFSNLTIGGQKPDGTDAVNEVSYLVLDAQKSVRMIQPTLSLRYFEGTPDDFLLGAAETVATGIGQPAFFGDQRIVPVIKEINGEKTLEVARDYCLMGCIVPFLQGGTDPLLYSGYVNLGKCLELTLNQGVDPITKLQVGPKTPHVSSFESIDDILAAYKQQVHYLIDMLEESRKIVADAHVTLVPTPFASAVVNDCITRAKPLLEGGARYNLLPPYWAVFTGNTNVADSLAAIKKFVFEDRVISLEVLNQVLLANFQGNEELWSKLRYDAPKYGNDDDYVDLIAQQTANLLCDGYPVPNHNCQSTGIHVSFGTATGATPDGRKAGQPLADGGVSPVYGRDTRGPTAIINSATKVDPNNKLMCYLMNMKFQPDLMAEEGQLRNFIALLKSYFQLGGHHVQFNVVKAETLLAAQKEPDKYRDLIVRVSGFSAFFTQLPKGVQDDIIARTTQTHFGTSAN